MNWITYIFVLFLALAVDASLEVVLKLHALGGIGPRFVPIMVVFAALFASRRSALWGAVVGGLLMDLSTPLPLPSGSLVYVPGPHALGCVAGVFLILQLRPLVFRGRALTIASMVLASMIVMSLVVVTIYTIRSWYPAETVLYPTRLSAVQEFARQLGVGVYSALIAVPFGWVLIQTGGLWGFPNAVSSRRLIRS